MKGIITKKLSAKFSVDVGGKEVMCICRGNNKKTGAYVGDRVEIKNEVIEKVYPRDSLLIRPPLANLQQLLIVIAPTPKPDLLLVDKLLLFAFVKGITPIVVINKSDISEPSQLQILKETYQNVCKVIVTSAVKNEIDDLKSILKNKISAFTGQSAVGKSALIKALDSNMQVEIGQLSTKIQRGKNTTRHCEMFKIAGGYIVDTAGFSSLDETLIEADCFELSYYYPDFLKEIQSCRYKSCLHTKEQECGVKEAVKKGIINKTRYENYKLIQQSLQQKWEKTHG